MVSDYTYQTSGFNLTITTTNTSAVNTSRDVISDTSNYPGHTTIRLSEGVFSDFDDELAFIRFNNTVNQVRTRVTLS